MRHRGVGEYDVYCHVRNPHTVYQNIGKLGKAISEKLVKIKKGFGEDERNESFDKLSKLKGHLCRVYFKRYFERDAKKGPLVLPPIQRRINKIVDTMEKWCMEANTSPSNLKGLVVHNFNLPEFLEKFLCDKSDAANLCEGLELKDFRNFGSASEPIVIVYNPKERIILLIRKSGEKKLSEEMEFCSDSMKIFMLLFGDECIQSGVKVICLLASSKTAHENLECEGCKKFVVPVGALQSYESFLPWMSNRSVDFDIKNTKKIDKDKVIAVSEKLIGCLAAAPYFENIPTFTDDADDQMKHVLMLLTHEQKDIIYSDKKHLIIRGPYGSGKSVVALKKLEILLKDLEESKKNEVAYFICHDSKSALLADIERIPNVKIHRREGGKKLSKLIKDIFEESNTQKVNLFVDEYDSENLDNIEIDALNRIVEEKFKDATFVLVLQSMEKERNISSKGKSTKVNKNKLDLLNMTIVDLYRSMRNPMQIDNLISATQNFLKEEKTKYQYPLTKPISKDSANLEKEYAVESAVFLKPKETVKKTASQVGNLDQITRKGSSDVKDQTHLVVANLEPEEAFATAQLSRASNEDETIIVNQYRYVESTGIGHQVSSDDNPELFEVDFEDTGKGFFEKLCALKCTFQELNIHSSNLNNKHVILHFDTSTNQIPELLTDAFQHLNIQSKVTDNYKDFKGSKSILVCYFRVLRGLEHSNLTVYIDQDMYNMQHYLVEVMARCTNKLSIVVLRRSDALSKIIKHWEDESKEKNLIDHWKVQESTKLGKREDYYVDENSRLIKINFSSENHEEMRKKFNQHGKQNRNFNRNLKRAGEAQENIRERY